MKNNITALLIFIFCFCGLIRAQNADNSLHGFKIIKDSQQHFYIANENDVKIIPVDSIHFSVDSVIADINRSSMNDCMLIVRVLQMHSNPAEKKKELMNMTQTYAEINLMVLRRAEDELKKRYSEKELEALRSKTK